VKFLQYIINCS